MVVSVTLNGTVFTSNGTMNISIILDGTLALSQTFDGSRVIDVISLEECNPDGEEGNVEVESSLCQDDYTKCPGKDLALIESLYYLYHLKYKCLYMFH